MQSAQTRRQVVATLFSATAASVSGGTRISAQEAPPETTTIRLGKIAGVCIAPQYVAEDLLRSEGIQQRLNTSSCSPRTCTMPSLRVR